MRAHNNGRQREQLFLIFHPNASKQVQKIATSQLQMSAISYINPNSINQGSVFVGSSRGELLDWLNGHVLQLGITKIEQCGTGKPNENSND